ncbi:MAG: ribosomal-processing cysteine protease Prp [Mycoplasma sp.]
MTSVKIYYHHNDISEIIVQGHALYDKKGKDVVCAGISSVVIGGFNSLNRNFKECVSLSIDDNIAKLIVIRNSKELQIAINVIVDQLETIAQSYTKNIKIEKVV